MIKCLGNWQRTVGHEIVEPAQEVLAVESQPTVLETEVLGPRVEVRAVDHDVRGQASPGEEEYAVRVVQGAQLRCVGAAQSLAALKRPGSPEPSVPSQSGLKYTE